MQQKHLGPGFLHCLLCQSTSFESVHSGAAWRTSTAAAASPTAESVGIFAALCSCHVHNGNFIQSFCSGCLLTTDCLPPHLLQLAINCNQFRCQHTLQITAGYLFMRGLGAPTAFCNWIITLWRIIIIIIITTALPQVIIFTSACGHKSGN